MHRQAVDQIRALYLDARSILLDDPVGVLEMEKFLADRVARLLLGEIREIQRDYDAASMLYPFWRNYPPLERGRQPIGDQFPWIEVGEHAVGSKLSHLLRGEFVVEDMGFPTGADQRFVVHSDAIFAASKGLTDAAWLCVDVKSVGPRDDQDHTVMSHNQISGSGEWTHSAAGVTNQPMTAVGSRANHLFYPALPPLIVLPSGQVAVTVTLALKPVYSMLRQVNGEWSGQPLDRIELVTIPNGLLLTQNPNYLKRHPGLLFPGKDSADKDPRKVRARVQFALLRRIDPWRHLKVWTRP